MKIEIKYFDQLRKNENIYKNIKQILKYFLIKISLKKKFKISNGSVFFPFYHHVFDDEIVNFKSHIKFMKNLGDFISYDDSIHLINEGISKKNTYFCLSFDDGFKNIINNVTEVLLNNNIASTFFIPTSFIGNQREDSGKVFFNNNNFKIDFLEWDDCKKISSEKLFTIGSHSENHQIISGLSYQNSLKEMKNSKEKIEDNLSIICNHFAPPLGDFSYRRDLDIAKEVGYKSLSSTKRGKMDENNKNVFYLKRHHFLANWEVDYLKFFFNI